MKHLLTFLIVLSSVLAFGQVETTFESFAAEPGAPLNRADDGFAFVTPEGLRLHNNFNEAYMSWSGWAISADTDVTTPGFTNQYSSISGAGNEGSARYATAFVSPASTLAVGESSGEELFFAGFYINNTTYAFLSMRDGDSFAKKFGGEDGNDPDFYKVDIQAFADGQVVDSLEHYLADYRFDDNTQDFIQDEWQYIDLSNLSKRFIDSLSFSVTGSDIGQFGLNTPAYFCIDDVVYDVLGSLDRIEEVVIEMGPNPVTNTLNISGQQLIESITLLDIRGNVMVNVQPDNTDYTLSMSAYPTGIYSILVTYEGSMHHERIVKL